MAYSETHDESAGANWAGNHAFVARSVQNPADATELRELILQGGPVRALGSRHSFSDLADTAGRLISLQRFPTDLVIDEGAQTASFSAGLRYGELATQLQDRGWALHNLASLPPHFGRRCRRDGHPRLGRPQRHSGNGGRGPRVSRRPRAISCGSHAQTPTFDGAVVALGALGIVTRVTLDIQAHLRGTAGPLQRPVVGMPHSRTSIRSPRAPTA